jgi:hypothetical protein
MQASPPEEQLEGLDDPATALFVGCAQLGPGVQRGTGMGPAPAILTPVSGSGSLGGATPDPPSRDMLVGALGGAGPTIYFKIFQFNPRVVHSSIQIEL